MSRLILHIGTHKTATTSIQKFFNLNREALSEKGVFYPDYSLIGQPAHYAHQAIINAFSDQHDSLTRDDARAFFAAVRARRADHDITLISAEPMYRHLDLAPGKTIPQKPRNYWPRRRAYIERLAEELGAAEVVVTFREQSDYAQSLYQEHVKATRYHHGLGRFRKEFWFHFEFLKQAKAWEKVFPGLIGLSYAHLCAGAGVEENFARAIGLDLPADLPRAGRQNESILPDMVVLKRLLHKTPHPQSAIRERIMHLEKMVRADPALLKALKSRSLFANQIERRAFQNTFAEENAKLAKRFLKNVPKGADPLPPPRLDRATWGMDPHPLLVDFLTTHDFSRLGSA